MSRQLIGQYANWSEFEAAALDDKPDVLVCEVNGLLPDTAQAVAPLRQANTQEVCAGGTGLRVICLDGTTRSAERCVTAFAAPLEHSQLLRERMRTPPRVRRTVGDEDVFVPV